VLVQNGTLKNQDNFVVGNTFGKIRAMSTIAADGRVSGTFNAGRDCGPRRHAGRGRHVPVVSDRTRRAHRQYRKMREREAQLAKSSRVTLEGLADSIQQAGMKELPLILKADVTGSEEVLAGLAAEDVTEKVRIKVIHSGVGAITESDCAAGVGVERDHHRVQRAAGAQGRTIWRSRKKSRSAALDHHELQDEIRKAMLACWSRCSARTSLGTRRVAERLPQFPSGTDCRLLRERMVFCVATPKCGSCGMACRFTKAS